MTNSGSAISRRGLFGAGIAAAALIAAGAPARAQIDGSPAAPIQRLNNALLVAMQTGSSTSFAQRYQALEPVIEQVFNLDEVLGASVGLAWSTMSSAQKMQLLDAFRRYTVTSYAANFNSFNGQTFQIMPGTRTLSNGEVIVSTQLVRPGNSPLRLDYVMRNGPAGWQAVDVLTDGSISRVAVQRSDFRGLLMAGGVSALASGLEHKTANVAGTMG